MLFFFNANGDIINYVPEQVHQGSNDANTIYVVAPLPSANQVLAHFTLPNGKVLYPAYATNENNLTLLSTLEINNEEYSVWGLKLNKKVTSISGNVIVQFSFINATQTITTQATMFFVSEGSSPYEPLDLTHETTLEDILVYISTLTTSIANKTKVTVNGIPQETWDADTKLDILNGNGKDNRIYAVSWDGKQISYAVSPSVKANHVVQRGTGGQIQVPEEPTADTNATSKKHVDTISKYYMHEVTIVKGFDPDSDDWNSGSIYLQILSRQPNMYISLADMVADTTLILPIVNCWNYTGDRRTALAPSITNASITWYDGNSGGFPYTINTTDVGYFFRDTPKPYEIPTT